MARDKFDHPCFRAFVQTPQGLSLRIARKAWRSFGARAMSNWSKSLAATTYVRAVHGGHFKRCCRKSGRYDGALRNHYLREDW